MEFLDTFGVSWPLFIAQIINFLVLYFILSKFLFKPILEVLEKRQKKIAEGLALSEKAQTIIAEAEKRQEALLAEAQIKFDGILADAAKKSENLVAEAESRARASADQIILDAQSKIKKEQENMRQELKGEVASLVAKGLMQLTRDIFTEEKDKKYIEKKLEEYKKITRV